MSNARDHYRCAREGVRYLLHVSGGRTSGLLLRRVLDARGGKPELTRFLMRYTCEDLRAMRMMPFDELERDRDANESVSCFCGD